MDEEVEVVPRWPFREYGEKEPVKIAVKVSRPSGERATAAA